MAAFDARHVHETSGAADQHSAGKRKFRNGLPSALGQRPGAIGEPLAALQRCTYQRMRLEPLEFLKRREIRIFIIEMDYEADCNKPVVEVIEKRAAAGAVGERPAECVLHQTRPVLFRRDLPQLFEPDPEFLRLAVFSQWVALGPLPSHAAAVPLR